MSTFWIVLLLALNFGISWWNAVVAGKSWVESKHVGGFIRLVVWSAAVQSACGFTIVIAAGLAGAGYAMGYLPMQAVEVMLNATYLLIVFPLLGSGLVITINNWVVAYRKRDLMSMGTAAWNTFAIAHDTYSAVSGVGDALSSVFKGVTNDNGEAKKKLTMLALVLVILAAAAGIILTAVLIHHYAGTVPLPEREAKVGR